MILGHVRDNFPRLMLTLAGLNGRVNVEFVVDTGFDGELSLPGSLLVSLEATFIGDLAVLLADKTKRDTAHYHVVLDWAGEERETEVMLMEGRPLIGNLLMEGNLLQIEMTDGGEVVIEPL